MICFSCGKFGHTKEGCVPVHSETSKADNQSRRSLDKTDETLNDKAPTVQKHFLNMVRGCRWLLLGGENKMLGKLELTRPKQKD